MWCTGSSWTHSLIVVEAFLSTETLPPLTKFFYKGASGHLNIVLIIPYKIFILLGKWLIGF